MTRAFQKADGAKNDPIPRRVLTALVLLVAVPALAAGARFAMDSGIAWPCPMRAVLHIPCPSCGSTRALSALSRGDVLSALRFNPLMTMAIPAGLVIPWLKTGVLSKFGWPILIGAAALNWAYLLLFLPP
jgi:hypothetical protein